MKANRRGQHVLVGATSFGRKCGLKDKFGVYARVSFYRKWLDENMKNPTFCASGQEAERGGRLKNLTNY